ncbi:MAG: C40 family peptidase [Acidobacteria bacterium]|nr:C40 family peptidase [Acidobacteriota bacterium]
MHQPLHRSTVIVLAVLYTSASLLAGGQAIATKAAPADLVKAVQEKVAPDRRLAVFEVTVEQKEGVVEVSGRVDRASSRDAVLKALREGGYPRVTDRLEVLPDPGLGERQYAVVTVSVATMKTKPSHTSELGNQLIMGMPVKVLKRDGGWYFVQSMDDLYLGYMEPEHLALMTEAELDAFAAASRVIVTVPFAMVREDQTRDAQPVCDLVLGNILLARRAGTDGYRAVRLPDGREGFVDSGSVMDFAEWKRSRRPTPENIEKTARLFMGVPYLWGGTSAKGFDCSGYTKTVFRANGVELQRDADQQSAQGATVPLEDDLAQLRKGDLVFFGPRPGVTRVTHVGIYLGDKLFIHCAGKVKLNSFDPASPLYSESLRARLVSARRLTT